MSVDKINFEIDPNFKKFEDVLIFCYASRSFNPTPVVQSDFDSLYGLKNNAVMFITKKIEDEHK